MKHRRSDFLQHVSPGVASTWLKSLCQDNVPLWTWSRLVGEIGFYGCEVLIVDAEGFDVEILKLGLPWLDIAQSAPGMENRHGP